MNASFRSHAISSNKPPQTLRVFSSDNFQLRLTIREEHHLMTPALAADKRRKAAAKTRKPGRTIKVLILKHRGPHRLTKPTLYMVFLQQFLLQCRV